MTEEAGATKPAQTHNASTPDQGYVVLVWADESIGATTTWSATHARIAHG